MESEKIHMNTQGRNTPVALNHTFLARISSNKSGQFGMQSLNAHDLSFNWCPGTRNPFDGSTMPSLVDLHTAMDRADTGTARTVIDTLTFLAFIRIDHIDIRILGYGFVRTERLAFSTGRADISNNQGHGELL